MGPIWTDLRGSIMGEHRIGEGAFRPLPSKISAPAQSGLHVRRSRAMSKLSRVAEYPLTTVVSPAGYGKTTAVASWMADGAAMPVAWFSAEEEDARPDRFWRYLLAALGAVDERLSPMEYLADDAAAFMEMDRFLDTLILAMADYPADFALVVEDLYTVFGNARIMEGIEYLIRHLPRNAHLVLTSRQQLRIPLAKLRVGGLVNELTESDLRFDAAELGMAFGKMGISATEGQLEQVLEVTGGWPAGVRMVALLCGGGSEAEIESAISSARGSMNEYLLEEVLESLPEFIGRFCLLTSAVDSFSVDLASSLCSCSREEAASAVAMLLADGLFIERIDRGSQEAWYRYHDLFASALREKLSCVDIRIEYDAKHAACLWLLDEGYVEDGLRIASELKEYDIIRDAILDNWKALYMADNHLTVVRWAHMLPEEYLLKSPFLSAVVSMPCALIGEMELAERLIMNAVMSLKDDQNFLFALCMAQKAYLSAFRDASDDMRAYAQKALDYFPEDEHYLRGMMMQIQASSFSDTEPLRTKLLFIEAVRLQAASGSKNLMCSAYGNLAYVCAELGHIGEARRYSALAMEQYAAEDRMSKSMLSHAYLSEAVCAYLEGDFESAVAYLASFDELFSGHGLSAVSSHAAALRAKIEYRLGQSYEHRFYAAIDEDAHGVCLSYPTLDMVEAYCRTYRMQACCGMSGPNTSVSRRLFDYACAFMRDEVACYEDMCSLADSIDPEERVAKIYACCLASAFSEKVAHIRRADRFLEEACRLAMKHGLVSAMEENMGYLVYPAQRVIAAHRDEPIASWLDAMLMGSAKENSDDAIRLSDREIDAIRYVSTGLTVAEAADRMCVSRETVKKHLSNIYAKLGVHSKLAAVALLKERGIL